MKKLNIEITKAQILYYSVTLKEKKPEISVTIGLFTDEGKKISDYSISTDSYCDESKFNLPTNIIPPILNIMKELETIVVKQCRDNQLQLKEGK